MRLLDHFRAWCLVAALGAPATLLAEGVPSKTLKDLKAASVYIKVDAAPIGRFGNPVSATGSGFLVHVAGDAGFIATNNHVVTPLIAGMPAGNPKVVFHSGTPRERTVEAQVVARDALNDLAILKISGIKDLPRPIAMDLDLEVNETMPVYAVGFPFGETLALGKSNPALTITKGTISSLRYDNRGQVMLLQIDAEVNSGNSGGPVVNEKGQLVGIAVSKLLKARTVGFAIPLQRLAEVVQGKVASVLFDTLWVVKGQAEVSIEAGLIDPLDKLKEAAIRYRVMASAKEQLPRPEKDGSMPPLKDANEVWLKLSTNRGAGRFTLKGAGRDKVLVAYQISYANAVGTTFSPISRAIIDFTQVIYSDRLTGADALDSQGKRHKVYRHRMKAGKHYVLNMRSDPKELDPRVTVMNAAGNVLGDDDGAGGLFDALLVISPPKDDDYQIIVSAVKGAGPFTLRIREDGGQELGAKGLTLSETLRTDDSADLLAQAPRRSFNVILRKDKSYVIEAASKEFEPYLQLDNMANLVLKYEDIGGGGRSKMFFEPFQDGIYRITATSFDARVGRFDFSVHEAPGLKQHVIGPDGLKVTGMLTMFDPLDMVNRRAGKTRCKVFPVHMKAKQKYQIDLMSSQFDAFLRIEDARGRELAIDDDSGGNLNARLFFTPPADGNYRIIATHFDARVGAFELVVRAIK